MQKIFIILFGLIHLLSATESSNAGNPKNDLGYYGNGVIFGGYTIVGDWRLVYNLPMTLKNDGTVEDGSTRITHYGVSEDGKYLSIFDGYTWEGYSISAIGDDGCFNTSYCFANDIGSCHEEIICKQNIENKIYGPRSPRKALWIKAGDTPPLLGSIPNYGYTVGDSVEIYLGAYVTMTDNDAYSIHINGTLPLNLELDSRASGNGNIYGYIRGSLISEGIYSIQVSARDRDGLSNPVNFKITVCPVGQIYNTQVDVCL